MIHSNTDSSTDSLLISKTNHCSSQTNNTDNSSSFAIKPAEGKPRSQSMRKSTSSYFVPKPALALDLDETLIYASPIQINPDSIPIRVNRRRMYVQFRPGLCEFLKRVQKLYDVFIFTASRQEYANQIIDNLFDIDIKECRRFFRDSCLNVSGYSVKDLSILRTPLKKTLLVDDIAGSALKHPRNLVRIRSWQGEKEDDVLLGQLMPLLEQLAFENDLSQSSADFLKKYEYDGLSTFKS
ncbi:NLI interacting factor-like phosphatase family protein [Tritrichomonas foetus]|uniref:Mitochondrial import inner membrane translocase subunit TIM50 n=1 Tax=Tritrichomonas foetus TaxID=1144522 RepID=A0A1J4JA27_9EUKA|nr:NLI interacting factor-like phosphatase family protein [Tritrichomonas foetus]|eukprot:OHS95521.1 NLI interacting factor-like phosphatase family protein [Tritrichomonas foetus]